MNIRPIRTEDDYKLALREASAFFESEPEPGTDDGDHFEVLLILIEVYEAEHYPVDLPGPTEPAHGAKLCNAQSLQHPAPPHQSPPLFLDTFVGPLNLLTIDKK